MSSWQKLFSSKYNKEKKEWYGREIPPLYNPKISIAQVILNSLTAHGPKIAQVCVQIDFD